VRGVKQDVNTRWSFRGVCETGIERSKKNYPNVPNGKRAGGTRAKYGGVSAGQGDTGEAGKINQTLGNFLCRVESAGQKSVESRRKGVSSHEEEGVVVPGKGIVNNANETEERVSKTCKGTPLEAVKSADQNRDRDQTTVGFESQGRLGLSRQRHGCVVRVG